MLKNVLIKNNLIAIAIHICLCLFIFLSFAFMYVDPILTLALVIPHVLTVFGLYFLVGRLFLHNIKNTAIDFISVTGLAIVLILVVFLAYTDLWIWGRFLLVPFFALSIILTNYLQISSNSIFILMILSLLPPLTMWTGLRAKQYVSTLEIQQSTLKSRLLLILSKRKQSLILFVVLTCLIYLVPLIIYIIMIIACVLGDIIEDIIFRIW